MPASAPWCSQEEWNQLLSFFPASSQNNTRIAEASRLAGKIARKISSVDACLQELCNQTCPSCTEICCIRANIWFDFRDLLFLFLLNGELPSRQIVKSPRHGCVNLTSKGCRLERLDRPFVCTWYLCPDQKAKNRLLQYNRHQNLYEVLQEVQAERKTMEDVFISGL